MNYNIHCEKEDNNIPLKERLLKARNISDSPDDFFNPTFSRYRQSPREIHDMEKAVARIIQAIERKEKIMIFGDYDVDGVTSSYLMYLLLSQYLKYPKVKIMYPDRLKDGYGMKIHHVDTMKAAGHDLIITVDNGITSIQEMIHAKNLGMQVIITDHHKALEITPEADAVINPQISNNYEFK